MNSLTSTVKVSISPVATKTRDLGGLTYTPQISRSMALIFGAGAAGVQQLADDEITIAASATTTLNLKNASLTNAYGETIAITKYRVIWVENKSLLASVVIRQKAAGTVFETADERDAEVDDTGTDTGLILPPKSCMLLAADGTDGWLVGSTDAGQITVTNVDVTNTATVQYVIMGNQ